MPMEMGIHCKPIGHGHSTSLDSRVRRNDGDMFFPRKRLTERLIYGDEMEDMERSCLGVRG